MNRNRISRFAKAATASVALSLGLTACTRDYTVAYVYVTSAKANPGVINQYSVDYQSGALTQVGTAVNTGANPVNLVPSPDGLAVYVVNKGDATVQEFLVQSDGSLKSTNSYKINGSSPDQRRHRSCRQVPVRHLHLPVRVLRNHPRTWRRGHIPRQCRSLARRCIDRQRGQ